MATGKASSWVDETTDTVSPAKKLLAYLTKNIGEFGGDPVALLSATDKYCIRERDSWMMHVGDKKGEVLRTIVQELAPKTCLELGTYCGYSAVLTASVLPKGSRIITLEAREEITTFAKEFIKLAGNDVNEKITLVGKRSEDVIPILREDFSVDTLDFVFIDHWEYLYVRDIKLLEAHGLLRKGSVVVADNTIFPGAPDYLEYVKGSGKYETEVIYSTLEYRDDITDALTKSIYLG